MALCPGSSIQLLSLVIDVGATHWFVFCVLIPYGCHMSNCSWDISHPFLSPLKVCAGAEIHPWATHSYKKLGFEFSTSVVVIHLLTTPTDGSGRA